MTVKKLSNFHLLYIDTKNSDEIQVFKFIDILLKSVFCKLRTISFDKEYSINVVRNGKGQLVGYSYLWLKDVRLYHILLGNNLDGKPLVKKAPDSNWKPGTKEQIQEIREKLNNTTDWFEIDEFSEELDRLLIRPNIEIKNDPYFDTDILKEYEFEIYPAYVYPARDNYHNHILRIENVPNDLNPKLLKKYFSMYATDSEFKNVINFKGKKICDTYPIIYMENRNNKKKAYIIFNNNTDDGPFALSMSMRFTLEYDGKKIKLETFYMRKK